jgi:hypothetical protein
MKWALRAVWMFVKRAYRLLVDVMPPAPVLQVLVEILKWLFGG